VARSCEKPKQTRLLFLDKNQGVPQPKTCRGHGRTSCSVTSGAFFPTFFNYFKIIILKNFSRANIFSYVDLSNHYYHTISSNMVTLTDSMVFLTTPPALGRNRSHNVPFLLPCFFVPPFLFLPTSANSLLRSHHSRVGLDEKLVTR
jgi:hypothetical protein